jgi:hypothetical protein
MEQMNEDGSPKSDEARWSVEPQRDYYSVVDYIKALFYAKPGRFRVITFVVTDVPLTFSDEPFQRHQLQRLMKKGAPTLSPEIGQAKFTAKHNCYVLIYEFEKAGIDTQAVFVGTSQFDTKTHLAKTGLLAALRGTP